MLRFWNCFEIQIRGEKHSLTSTNQGPRKSARRPVTGPPKLIDYLGRSAHSPSPGANAPVLELFRDSDQRGEALSHLDQPGTSEERAPACDRPAQADRLPRTVRSQPIARCECSGSGIVSRFRSEGRSTLSPRPTRDLGRARAGL